MNENTALYRAIEQAVILPCAGEMDSIADVECDFSETYKKKVNRLIKDRSRPYYPLIKTTLRKTIFIIAAVLMMSTITVAAVPQLREWFVGLFVSQNENNADVHAVQGAIPADDMNDEFIYYEPTFIPKGFVEESRIKDIAHLGIDYRFKNKIIFYSQSPLTATHNIDTENRKTEALRSSLFVACFSEVNNSFPMWGYYAADHKGICLGYNLYELVKKYQCMPVIYSDKLIFYREDSSEKNILANTLTKSDEWIHEKEWRIVIKDDINIGKSGIIKDFVLPREIYIGCRQQETVAENNNNRMLHSKKENEMYADLDEILQWAENNYIDVYMPIISRKEYKMIDRALRLI